MSRLYEEKHFVPVAQSTDINGGMTGDSILMKNYDHATFLVYFGADLSGDAVLTISSGATDAAETTAMTFAYRYGSAATGSATSDTLSDETTSAALTCTGTTYVSRLLICEVDANAMTDGHDWLTLSLSSAASAGYCYVIAILNKNYKGSAAETALS